MAITLDNQFLDPPQDAYAQPLDPGAPGGGGDGGYGLPGGSEGGTDPGVAAVIAGDNTTTTNKLGNYGVGAGDFNTNTPAGLDTIAQQQADTINRQTNQGQGAGNAVVANTATFPGDIATGQTFGNPTPIGGAAPTTTGGLPGGSNTGQLSDAAWQKQFQDAMGYFNPQWESRAAFLEEAARGDQAIRGQQVGGPHIDELARMAQYDSDAKRLYDKIQATPDFYRGANAAQWTLDHNAATAGLAQGAVGGGQQTGGQGFNGGLGRQPQQAAQGPDTSWLRSQLVNEVRNPVDNAHALLSDQMRQGIVDNLAALGATNFHMGFDAYNNATLNYTSKSGTPETINASLVDYANALETLKQRVAAQAPAAPAGGGGGGYAPRGYAPRGGGGGGGGAAQTPPANPYAAEVGAYDTSVTPTTGIRGPDNGPGAVFGTNIAGTTVGGPYSNQTAPLSDEFGRPYGRRYGQTGLPY